MTNSPNCSTVNCACRTCSHVRKRHAVTEPGIKAESVPTPLTTGMITPYSCSSTAGVAAVRHSGCIRHSGSSKSARTANKSQVRTASSLLSQATAAAASVPTAWPYCGTAALPSCGRRQTCRWMRSLSAVRARSTAGGSDAETGSAEPPLSPLPPLSHRPGTSCSVEAAT